MSAAWPRYWSLVYSHLGKACLREPAKAASQSPRVEYLKRSKILTRGLAASSKTSMSRSSLRQFARFPVVKERPPARLLIQIDCHMRRARGLASIRRPAPQAPCGGAPCSQLRGTGPSGPLGIPANHLMSEYTGRGGSQPQMFFLSEARLLQQLLHKCLSFMAVRFLFITHDILEQVASRASEFLQ